jgi:dCTP deaminase
MSSIFSRRQVQVPPDYAANGAVRSAGGQFGRNLRASSRASAMRAPGRGSRAVLEVRSREVPFILEHGQIVGRLVYEKMLARPKSLYGAGIGSNYQAQSLKLSKHFRA